VAVFHFTALAEEGIGLIKEEDLHYAFFARAGFTAAAEEELNQHHGLAITLSQMDDDMAKAYHR
jgi:hypothetical protein